MPPRMVRGRQGWADAIPEDNLTGQTGEEWWETRMVDWFVVGSINFTRRLENSGKS